MANLIVQDPRRKRPHPTVSVVSQGHENPGLCTEPAQGVDRGKADPPARIAQQQGQAGRSCPVADLPEGVGRLLPRAPVCMRQGLKKRSLTVPGLVQLT